MDCTTNDVIFDIMPKSVDKSCSDGSLVEELPQSEVDGSMVAQ